MTYPYALQLGPYQSYTELKQLGLMLDSESVRALTDAELQAMGGELELIHYSQISKQRTPIIAAIRESRVITAEQAAQLEQLNRQVARYYIRAREIDREAAEYARWYQEQLRQPQTAPPRPTRSPEEIEAERLSKAAYWERQITRQERKISQLEARVKRLQGLSDQLQQQLLTETPNTHLGLIGGSGSGHTSINRRRTSIVDRSAAAFGELTRAQGDLAQAKATLDRYQDHLKKHTGEPAHV